MRPTAFSDDNDATIISNYIEPVPGRTRGSIVLPRPTARCATGAMHSLKPPPTTGGGDDVRPKNDGAVHVGFTGVQRHRVQQGKYVFGFSFTPVRLPVRFETKAPTDGGIGGNPEVNRITDEIRLVTRRKKKKNYRKFSQKKKNFVSLRKRKMARTFFE